MLLVNRKTKLNDDWSKVDIDIMDSIDLNEDLTHSIDHPKNILVDAKINFKKYTCSDTSNHRLTRIKLNHTELCHIHNYDNDNKYNIINKK